MLMSATALLLGGGAVDCTPSKQETLFKRGQTRVFTDSGREVQTIYGCSSRLRRPRKLGELTPGGDQRFYAGPRFGRRVVLQYLSYGEDDVYSEVGWWDERTNTRRWGDAGNTIVEDSVVGADGAMATAYSLLFDEEERLFVGYLCVRERRLGRMLRLAQADVDPASLRVAEDEVTWTTKAGEAGSAPRDERRCR